MSRSYSALKRTRSTVLLAKRAQQRDKEQRAVDKAARRLVAWGRSR